MSVISATSVISRGVPPKFLSFRHIRVEKGDRWIALRRPVNLSALRWMDRVLKPDYVYYTQGRFFRPYLLRDKESRESFFLYQDTLVVDLDDWEPSCVERVIDAGEKICGRLVYMMFTGNGLHFCFERPRLEREKDPWKREEEARENNLKMLKDIAERADVYPDLLPEPRHIFKLPVIMDWGNRGLRVWWGPEAPPPRGELMTLLNTTKQRGRAEEAEKPRPPRPSFHIAWTNNVVGTRAFVLFCRVREKRDAESIVERWRLHNSFFVDCDIPYLLDLNVVNRDRALKILRRESSRSLAGMLKYGFNLDLLGKMEEINADGKGLISRGHCFYVRAFSKRRIYGNTGKDEVILHLVRRGAENG